MRGRSPGTSPVARPPWSRQGQSVLEVLQAGDGGSPWHVVRRSGEVSSQLESGGKAKDLGPGKVESVLQQLGSVSSVY